MIWGSASQSVAQLQRRMATDLVGERVGDDLGVQLRSVDGVGGFGGELGLVLRDERQDVGDDEAAERDLPSEKRSVSEGS